MLLAWHSCQAAVSLCASLLVDVIQALFLACACHQPVCLLLCARCFVLAASACNKLTPHPPLPLRPSLCGCVCEQVARISLPRSVTAIQACLAESDFDFRSR
jgi:hypothetical protein